MPNYSDGKIYKLVDNITDDVYIGSTIQTLCKRKGGHESAYKYYLKGKGHYVTSFKIVKNRDYRIVLIENYSCLDKSQLHEREKYWIKQSNCVNKVIPKRTIKEYREDNKTELKESKKQNDKKYREANKDKFKQRDKQYWEANKDEIKAKRALKYMCDCSAVVTYGAKSKHMKSIKHQNYLKSLEPPTQ